LNKIQTNKITKRFIKIAKKKPAIFIILAIVGLICLASCNKDGEKHFRIVFRMDDYSDYSDPNIEQAILEIFDKHNVKLSLAVIPFTNDEHIHDLDYENRKLSTEKEEVLLHFYNKGLIDIALHGYNHKAVNYNTVWLTEFESVDYTIQKRRISKAQEYLEEIIGDEIRIFVPPWNSYDINTLKVLEENDFSIISAAPTGISDKNTKIKYLPFTCELHELDAAISSVSRNSPDNPALIVVLFHPSDFTESGYSSSKLSLPEIEKTLISLKAMPNTELHNISSLADSDINLSSRRLDINCGIYKKSQYLPPALFSGKWFRYYDNEKDYLNSLLLIFLILYYSAIGVLAFFAVKFPARRIHKFLLRNNSDFVKLYKSKIIIAVKILVSLTASGMIIYTSHDFDINYRGLTVIIVMSGITAGVFFFMTKPTSR
jgi:peptidoglycan/xylan/chitin deacetylase (PgdA/CDA1 family)